jgi:TPR repeat protein
MGFKDVERRLVDAFLLFVKAANKSNNPFAQYMLGMMSLGANVVP